MVSFEKVPGGFVGLVANEAGQTNHVAIPGNLQDIVEASQVYLPGKVRIGLSGCG